VVQCGPTTGDVPLTNSRSGVTAVGPLLKYDSGEGWFVSLKWQHESHASNRPEGQAWWIKAVLPL